MSGLRWTTAAHHGRGKLSRRLSGRGTTRSCSCSRRTRCVYPYILRTSTDPAQWRPLYDLHISTQVTSLIETIRHRAYVQYFEPFQNVQLARMATTFGAEGGEAVDAFERDVVGLVQAGKLSARVDDIEKVCFFLLFAIARTLADSADRSCTPSTQTRDARCTAIPWKRDKSSRNLPGRRSSACSCESLPSLNRQTPH
jgi:hypothetical protein